MAIGAASAAEKKDSIATQITSTVTDYFKDKALGVVKSTALKFLGSELSKAGVSPILTSFLGIEEDGPSNQDILDQLNKSTEEIKAEIAKVLEATMELSNQTANYHRLQMNQLKAINGGIDTKDFRTQADTVAADFAHAIKRIDENKANITCDSGKNFNIQVTQYGQEVVADSKNGFKSDKIVKGINDMGGFNVPDGKEICIEMTGWSNGFYAQAKTNMPIFKMGNNAKLELRHADLKGGYNHILIPDNAKNATVTLFGCNIYSSKRTRCPYLFKG